MCYMHAFIAVLPAPYAKKIYIDEYTSSTCEYGTVVDMEDTCHMMHTNQQIKPNEQMNYIYCSKTYSQTSWDKLKKKNS